MHRYDIYLLRPDIARQFIQMENKLFQLFKEYETVPSLRDEAQKQVDYICRPISIYHLGEWLSSRQLQSGIMDETNSNERFVYYLEEDDGVKLAITERRVEFWSRLDKDEEWPWFDQLQAYDPYFFACDIERQNYGWLKPVKMHSHLYG